MIYVLLLWGSYRKWITFVAMPTCWCCLYLFIFPASWEKWCWLFSFCKSAVILDVSYLLQIFICYLWWNIYCFSCDSFCFLFFLFVGLNGKVQGRARLKTNKRESHWVTSGSQIFSNWTMRMMMSQQWCRGGCPDDPSECVLTQSYLLCIHFRCETEVNPVGQLVYLFYFC